MSDAEQTEPVSLRWLALEFLRIGATGFGGPMALIGLMQQRVVERRKAITPEQFAEGVAVGQVLPGPIAVDCATYIGYRLRGLWGAVVTTGALVAPPFLAMLVLTPLYLQYGKVPEAQGFFRGVGAAVVAVIAAACVRLGQRSLGSAGPVVIAIGALAGALLKVQPILLILAAGLLGLLLLRERPQEAAA